MPLVININAAAPRRSARDAIGHDPAKGLFAPGTAVLPSEHSEASKFHFQMASAHKASINPAGPADKNNDHEDAANAHEWAAMGHRHAVSLSESHSRKAQNNFSPQSQQARRDSSAANALTAKTPPKKWK